MVASRLAGYFFAGYRFVGARLLCGLYLALIVTHWGGHKGGFSSLSGVMLLFTDRWLVLAGWVHYLAFDLFIGSWQVRDARRNQVPFLLVAPVLGVDFSLWTDWVVAVFVSGGDRIPRQSVARASGGRDLASTPTCKGSAGTLFLRTSRNDGCS